MTHREVYLCLEGYGEKLKREAQYNALIQTGLYNNIAIHAQDGQQKDPADLFPKLFDKERVELTEEDEKLIIDYLNRCN